MKSVSIVVPAYNEGDSVEETVSQITSVLSPTQIDWEIVVVNDGSNDNTKDVLAKLKRNNPNLITPKHKRNIGYGASLKTGIKNAKYEKIIITDADRTYDNTRIPEIVKLLDDYSMVVGARTINRNSIPLVRRPAKWILRMFVSILMSFKIPDLNSGLRGFHKTEVTPYLPLFPNQFSFTTTITIAYLSDSLNIKYIDTEYFKREGKSKIRPIHDFFGFIIKIIQTVIYFTPYKIFFPPALLFLSLFIISFIYDIFFLQDMTEKTLILLLASMNFFTIGFLSQLIIKRTPRDI